MEQICISMGWFIPSVVILIGIVGFSLIWAHYYKRKVEIYRDDADFYKKQAIEWRRLCEDMRDVAIEQKRQNK